MGRTAAGLAAEYGASIRQKGEGDFDTMLEDLDFRGFAGCRAVRALAIGLPMRGRGVIAISSRSPPLVALRIRWDQRFESSSLQRGVNANLVEFPRQHRGRQILASRG